MNATDDLATDPMAASVPPLSDASVCATTPHGRMLVDISNRLLGVHECVRELQALLNHEAQRSAQRDATVRQIAREIEAHRLAVEPIRERLQRIEAQLVPAQQNGNGSGH